MKRANEPRPSSTQKHHKRIKRKDDILCRISVPSANPLLEDKRYTDCSFRVGDEMETIEAHKIVLATASPVFDAMLFGRIAETKFPIEVPDISAGGFKAMIQYIYRSVAPLGTMDDLCQLWSAANKYQIDELSTKCVDEICKHVATANVSTVLDYAFHFQSVLVECRCIDVISAEPRAIFTNENFVNMSLAVLIKILSLNDLPIRELEIFNAVMKWSEAQCERQNQPKTTENLRAACKGAFEKIRFLAMTGKEFTRGPATSPMLTQDETYGILMSMPDPQRAGTLAPYPTTLSKLWYTRVHPFIDHRGESMSDSGESDVNIGFSSADDCDQFFVDIM